MEGEICIDNVVGETIETEMCCFAMRKDAQKPNHQILGSSSALY